MTGVLQRERERRKAWADLDLPDPVAVLMEERGTELKTGEPFVSPKRAALDAYFAEHGDDKKPNGW
jgi:hypothetical protein